MLVRTCDGLKVRDTAYEPLVSNRIIDDETNMDDSAFEDQPIYADPSMKSKNPKLSKL